MAAIIAAFVIEVMMQSSIAVVVEMRRVWPFMHGTIRISVCERAIERYAAMALMKRSPKMTAN